jgi:AraC-like DNA-binding protein
MRYAAAMTGLPTSRRGSRGRSSTALGPRGETLSTWQRQRAAALSPRSTRRVDWPLIVGGSLRLPLSQAPAAPEDALSVLEATDELSGYRDENTLLRRAVELARSALGVERAAIFSRGRSLDLLHGTWGSSAEGETTDEREIAFVMGAAHREAMTRASAGLGRWLLLDSAPLTAHVQGTTRIVGYGWNALTPIQSARGMLGLFVNDAAISGAPVDEKRQAQVVLYCALLGNLWELVRAERRALAAGEVEPAQTLAPSAAADIAARVLGLLEEDSALGRRQLAARLGVSESCLSRAFKSEMGFSVSQYRSRIKLERFFALVDGRRGNLLAAALDAGFGSYAQFHRVFRSVLGKTPSEYLAER